MFGGMGFQEMAIIAVVAIMLFGKRLPEVARSFGQSYKQFREGLNEIQRSMNTSDYGTQKRIKYDDVDSTTATDYEEPTAPKFELPAPEPQVESISQSEEKV